MKKKVGIIGGLGPLATVKFMGIINRKIKNASDEIEIVVINDPTTPDRTDYILSKEKANPIHSIINMVHKLEKYKVDIIVMPCNTASYFYKNILGTTNIPFINIVEETVRYLYDNNIKKVGLLATEGTIKSNTYSELLKQNHIEYIIPNPHQQDVITDIIYNGVKACKEPNIEGFNEVSKCIINEGAEKIILGCTELSVLKENKLIDGPIFIDSMDCLAESILKKLNITILKQ